MKKTLRRLLPITLGMAMLFSTTAFAATTEEAKNVYAQMQAKSQSIADGNTYCHMDLSMAADGESMDMALDMNMLYKNINQPEKMEMMCQYSISSEGAQMPMMLWYKDGYYYTQFMDQKMKTKTDVVSAMNAAMDPLQLAKSVDYFSDLDVKVEGDKYILSYKMDDTKINDMITQVFSQMGLGSLTSSGMALNIHDITGDYTINSDFSYEKATISMVMDMTAQGSTLSMNLKGDISQLNPGQPVEIMFPDFSGYEEVDTAQNAA